MQQRVQQLQQLQEQQAHIKNPQSDNNSSNGSALGPGGETQQQSNPEEHQQRDEETKNKYNHNLTTAQTAIHRTNNQALPLPLWPQTQALPPQKYPVLAPVTQLVRLTPSQTTSRSPRKVLPVRAQNQWKNTPGTCIIGADGIRRDRQGRPLRICGVDGCQYETGVTNSMTNHKVRSLDSEKGDLNMYLPI